jgi:hypothetical protein
VEFCCGCWEFQFRSSFFSLFSIIDRQRSGRVRTRGRHSAGIPPVQDPSDICRE